jgi:glycosyltransferase involved in cell wall biosynthesis
VNQPVISVIIPNYNNAGYLRECLDSVLSQTWKSLEVLVADDCSTDGSIEIIQEYARRDSRIVPFFNPVNMDVSANRASTIQRSTGTYLTTLDSDDFYYCREKLESEMSVVLKNMNIFGEDVCAFSNVMIVDEMSKPSGLQWPEDRIAEGEIFKFIFARSRMIPRDFIFSRKRYDDAGGYDPGFNLFEDWDLKIRMSRNCRFFYSGITGISYRRKGSGLSYVPVEMHINAQKAIFEKNRHLIRQDEYEEIKSSLERLWVYMKENQK